MSDLESHVRDLFDTVTPQPPRPINLDALGLRTRPRSRQVHLLWPIAAAAVVLAVVAIALVLRPSTRTTASAVSPSARAVTAISYGGVNLILRHPADWKFRHAFDGSLGPTFLDGYLSAGVTVHPFVSQCTTTARSTECGGGDPYVTELPPDAVFITLDIGATATRPTLRPDRLIDGNPAYIEKTTADQCPPGTTSGLIVSLYVDSSPNNDTAFEIKACVSGPQAATELQAMVNTATVTRH